MTDLYMPKVHLSSPFARTPPITRTECGDKNFTYNFMGTNFYFLTNGFFLVWRYLFECFFGNWISFFILRSVLLQDPSTKGHRGIGFITFASSGQSSLVALCWMFFSPLPVWVSTFTWWNLLQALGFSCKGGIKRKKSKHTEIQNTELGVGGYLVGEKLVVGCICLLSSIDWMQPSIFWFITIQVPFILAFVWPFLSSKFASII